MEALKKFVNSNSRILLYAVLFLFAFSLAGNGLQCGLSGAKTFMLNQARKGLELALAQKKALEAKVERQKYEIAKKFIDKSVAEKDDQYKKLDEQLRKAYAELEQLRKKIKNLSVRGLADSFKKMGY